MTSTHARADRTDHLDQSIARRLDVLRFGGPENLRVARGGPMPDLDAGHARIRVLTSSLSLSDSIVRRGLNPYTSALPQPFTLGYAFVGVVEHVREPAGGIAAGDVVADMTRWGANADLLVRPVGSLTRIGVDVDPVALEPLVMNGITAYQTLRIAGVRRGHTVLVHGATGGVGLLLTELAAHLGARVLGTGSPGKHDALRAKGAVALDGRAADLPDRLRVLAPGGVDAVFDGVGGPSRVDIAAALRPGGTFVGFGFAGPASQISSPTPEVLRQTARVLAEGREVLDRVRAAGSTAVEFEVGTARDRDRSAYDTDLDALVRLLADGTLRPEVRAVGFDDVVAAHSAIDAGGIIGRLVLDHRRISA